MKTEMAKESFFNEAMSAHVNMARLQSQIGEAEFEVKIKSLTNEGRGSELA